MSDADDREIFRAREILKKRTLESRSAAREGRIGTYLHSTGKVAAMVELTCDTDLVARSKEFHNLLKEFAVAVCAFAPLVVSKDHMPPEIISAEKEKYANDLKGKPPEIAAKIIEGKLEKNLYSKMCLLHIPFPKEEEFRGTYGEFLRSKAALFKETIAVRHFVRMEVGR